jgi:uncharacterized protein (DUF433 family)
LSTFKKLTNLGPHKGARNACKWHRKALHPRERGDIAPKRNIFQTPRFFVVLFKHIPNMFIYKDVITIEDGKRGGKPCIRGMRITVEDILRWLASEMSFEDILNDFTELTRRDLSIALEFSAMRQHRTVVAA